MKYILILLLFNLSFGQVTFNNIPLDKQLVGRDINTNLGQIIVDGEVNNTSVNYDTIDIELYRENVLQNTFSNSLNYTGNLASFNFSIPILAELANYSIKIYGKLGATLTLEEMVEDIVAGDAFIVQGQSNAEAQMFSGSANTNQDNFIRVYAKGTDNIPNLLNTDEWFIGEGDGDRTTNGNTGQWGLKLAKTIVEDTNIPVAIFNGAHDTQPIAFFQPPSNYQTSLDTNYGRLYHRINKNGLNDYVRAVFWSQGEEDGNQSTPISQYKTEFTDLKNSWLADFTNIEKFYIFQTKSGCGLRLSEIKEAQRQLAFEQADISIMPTSAMIHHTDNCHFQFTDGYELFADRISPLVKRDLYGVSTTLEIDAPMITNAYLSNSTTLIVETNATNLTIASIAEDFELSNAGSATITNITTSQNNIIFTLSENPGTNPEISYLAQRNGIGNFITNTNNLELICFYQYPVNTQIPVITFEEYAGAEEADGITTGVIEPAANGNSPVTGWFFGEAGVLHNNYSFSDTQKATGDYSIKFDTNQGSTSTDFSALLGGTAAPAASKIIASGDNEINIKVYIDSNPPTSFNTNIQDNDGVVSQQNISWDLTAIPSSQYGTWVSLSQVVNFNPFTNGRLQLRISGADIPTQTPTIIYFDDITIKPFVQMETIGTFGTTPVNWEDTSTWASGVVPGPDDNVLIKDRVNIFSNITVKRLELETSDDRILIQKSQSLTVTNDLETKDGVELYSDSNEYSSLIPLGSVTGNIKYFRSVTGSPVNDLISLPAQGWTFGDFITDSFNDTNLESNPTTPTERLFGHFDNANGAYVNYDDITNASTVLVPGKGYRVGRTSNGDFSFTGTVETGTVNIAVTDETATNLDYGRWNLIGNPYPSYLGFGAFFTENSSEFDTGAFQAIYGYNGSAWTVWNNLNATDKIAPGQAFFIRTKVSGGTVKFEPAMRTNGSSDDFIVGNSSTPIYVLSELNLITNTDTFSTKIYFAENQTRGLDPGYDASGFGGNSGGIYTHLLENSAGLDFAIQALPYNDFNDVIVPVGVNVDAGVQSTIGLNTITSNIPSNINIYLEDNETNTLTLLNNTDYTFTSSVALDGIGRFYLHYSNSALSLTDNSFESLNIYTNQPNKQVIITGTLNADTLAIIYDIQGRAVLSKELNTIKPTNTIDANSLSTGIYIVKLSNASGSITKKVILN